MKQAKQLLKPKYICTWCCKPTKTLICPRCKCDDNVMDANKPHTHQWSRKTINSIECKVCGVVQRSNETNTW